MNAYMTVASFSPEDDLPQMNAVIAEEVAQVKALSADGRLSAVHVSLMHGRVFLVVNAEDEVAARAIVETLPMAQWWTLDVFPLMRPPDQQR